MFRLSYIVIERTDRLGGRLRGVLEVLKEVGYEGVELNLTEPAGVDWDRLEGWLGELGLVVPSFLTGEAYRDGLCLSSRDVGVRRRTVERLIGYLATARRFHAVLVVGLLQGLRSDEPDEQPANERIAECMREVAAAAEEKGVEIVIEPVNHLQVGFNNSVAEVRRLIERVGSRAVRPMVDTVHMNIEERSLTGPVLELGAELAHVHLCESNGGVFGSGHVDFGAVLGAMRQIGYERFGSVKVYRGATLEEGARTAMEYLKRVSGEWWSGGVVRP